MKRHRMIRETLRDGVRSVDICGSVIAPDEICELLDWEAQLHEAGGWNVKTWPGMVRAEKPDCVRWLYVRQTNAMEDTLT